MEAPHLTLPGIPDLPMLRWDLYGKVLLFLGSGLG